MTTKVKLIAPGAVTTDSLDFSSFSTTDISEGTNLYYTDARVQTKIDEVIDSAPGALDTLNELAAALGDDPNFATTVTNNLATKAPLADPSFTGNVGIGVIGPTAKLSIEHSAGDTIDLEKTSNDLPSIRFKGNTSDTILQGGNVFEVWTNGAKQLNLDSGGLSITGDVNVGGGIRHGAHQQETTLLTGIGVNGPVWKVRYDSVTSNRYVDFGHVDGLGTWSSGLKLYNNQTMTWPGNASIGTSSQAKNLHVLGKQSIEGAGNVNRGNLILGQEGSGFNKWSAIASTHYDDATGSGNGSGSAGVMLIGSFCSDEINRVYIGHGPYEINPATEIRLGTHDAITHSLGGTAKMIIKPNGSILANTETNYPSFRESKFVSKASGVDIAATFIGDGDSNTQIVNIIRNSGDGPMLEFREGASDGTQVGMVSTISDDMAIGKGGAGLRFNGESSEILPHNLSTNTTTDGAVTLGYSGLAFANLYVDQLAITAGTTYSADYTWTTAWSTNFQTIVPNGVLGGTQTFLIHIFTGSWGGAPYYAASSFIFATSQGTNGGSSEGNGSTYYPLTSHHTASPNSWEIRTTTGVNSTNGVCARFTGYTGSNSNTVYVRVTRIASF